MGQVNLQRAGEVTMRMPLVDMKQSAPETGTVRAIIPDQMSQLQKQNAVVSDNDELRQFDK